MYQLEVKRHLVEKHFPPGEGWSVTVDIDAMERARGEQHPPDKRDRAEAAESALVALGVTIGTTDQFRRADVVARHPQHGTTLVEVEGDSTRQKEQAMYSALGQTVLLVSSEDFRYAIAVPDELAWEQQLRKIPERVRTVLRLSCLLVSETRVRVLSQ